MNNKKQNLVEDFQTYFSLELATTASQMECVHRIRYRVYCEEFGYESAEAFPEKLEMDEFDSHSTHLLIMHKSSGLPAACVRLVNVDDHKKMPMEAYCSESMDHDRVESLVTDRSTMCEFSRLAVDGAFRRRAGELASRFGELDSLDCSKREQRTFSLIAVSAFVAAFAVGNLSGRTNAFAMMEPFLPRLLRRSGIVVHRVGQDTDYHGLRAPYFITTQEAAAGMPAELREFYEEVNRKFASQLMPPVPLGCAAARRAPAKVA